MGAEVLGVDLSLPLDKNHFERILEAFHRHLLLVFPGQHIDEAQQVAFSRRFGELQVHVLDQYRHPRHPEIYVLSNVDPAGNTTGAHPDKGTLVWHSDLSFQRRPALATILYGIEVPGTGGDTLFADMCAAYDALDGGVKEFLSAGKAVHDLDVSRRRAGEPPMTERLMAHATQERFVFRHCWGTRDVVMWDNRCTMHCATHYDPGAEHRIIYRTVVKGDVPV
jgi:taurine dioxygenase